MSSENVISVKAFFSDRIRSGCLVPYQKSHFLVSFSNSIIRSGLRIKISTMKGLFSRLNFRPLRSSQIYERVNRDVLPLTSKRLKYLCTF